MNKFFRFVLAGILSLAYFLLPAIAFAQALGVYWDTGGDDFGSVGVNLAPIKGQTFTTSTDDFELTSIDLYLWKKGNTGNIVLDIYDTTAGLPVGSILASSIVDAETEVSENTTAGWCVGDYWVTFDFENYILSGNTTYAISLDAWDFSGDADNNVRWGRQEVGAYSGGASIYYSGDEWHGSAYDYYFRTYGVTTPEITTLDADNITYNSDYADWDIDFNAYIDSDGGEDCTVGWIMRELPDGEFGYVTSADGEYSTGDNVTTTLIAHGLEAGVSYEYYARATNSKGYTDGNVVEFEVEAPEQEPVIITLANYISTNATALTAEVVGDVYYDGTSNVTGYFYWREKNVGEWLLSSNTTDLQSGDMFDATLTDLSLETAYQYQAAGLNEFGEGLGGIAEFTILTVTQPNVETLPAEYITNTGAYLSGNVTSLGNDTELECWIQYRVGGTHIWHDTPSNIVFDVGKYTDILSSLIPETNYEFRAVVKASVLGGSETFTDYGDIYTFSTFGTYTIPIMTTGNATFVSTGLVKLISTIYYDGGYPVNAYARYREKNTTTWSNSTTSYNAVTSDEIWHLVSDIQNNRIYEYQSVGVNEIGTGYGSIRTFLVDATGGITGDEEEPTDEVNAGTDIINNLKTSLGLIGVFGSWALLFILILAVALVFGIAMLTVDGVARQAVAVAWILSSIALVGGFLFTGELGVWAIVIATGSVIAIIIIFVSVKLTGGGNQI